MNNEQIATLFSAGQEAFGIPLSHDYRDRAVDLAIYFNETIEDNIRTEEVIEAIRWAMMLAYATKYNLDLGKVEEEVNDTDASAEEVFGD